MTDGKRRVAADVLAAKPVKAPASKVGRAQAPAYILNRFESDADGFYLKKEDGRRLWICKSFDVVAAVRDGEQAGWGLLLQWSDPDGRVHEEVIFRASFASEGGELRTQLAGGGLYMNNRQDARQALLEYLNAVQPVGRAHIVGRSGWADVGGSPTFVLPNRTIGKTKERVIFHTPSKEPSPFNQAGTLASWRSEISERAVLNSRLLLAISTAFAGPLLGLLNEEGGGFHLRGPAKIAKTLALVLAASVWGGTPGSGAKGFVLNWRGTANAIEGTAALHSDVFAAFDEAGQIDGKELSDVVYMLANGRGKLRADRTGSPRAALKFRLMYLSSGEISIAAKIAEAGKTLRAGQEVRCIDLPADAGLGHGVFDTLGEEASSAEELAQSLYVASRSDFGTAGPAYLAYLVDCVRRDPDLPSRLAIEIETLCRSWLAERPATSGQVRTIAKRFALVAIAGELASRAAVTGWGPGIATAGVKACFLAWLADRGTSGSRENVMAVTQLRDFVQRFGASRFSDWEKPKEIDNEALQAAPEPAPPREVYRPQHRAGWRKFVPKRNAFTYYITPEAMRNEILKSLTYNDALKALVTAKCIVPDHQGKSAISIAPPGEARTRLFKTGVGLLDDGDLDGSGDWQAPDEDTE